MLDCIRRPEFMIIILCIQKTDPKFTLKNLVVLHLPVYKLEFVLVLQNHSKPCITKQINQTVLSTIDNKKY